VSLAGIEAFASAAVCLDADGVVRRLSCDEESCPGGNPGDTLAGRMAGRIGARSYEGEIIDFALGGPFRFISFVDVLDWFDRNEHARLASVFRNRPVFLGTNLPYADRHRVPVPLLETEPGNRRLPGVVVHAQALRSFLHEGLLRRAGMPLVVLPAVLGTLFWFGRGGRVKTLLFALFLAAAVALSTVLLTRGTFLPVAAALTSGTAAFLARVAFEGVRALREKLFLRRIFGSYVSPEVLKEILAGRIRPGLGGSRKHICVLFSDIRGFTARSEALPPESVIAMLNDYFSAMTAAVHRHGGTLDKFIGDGIMALFGVPQRLDCPELVALETAQEMLARLHDVNRSLDERGLEPIRIGIGLHSGDAVVGHVGSASRHEYTAIGDVVNVASRLEGLTKELDYPIVCSGTVASAARNFPGLVDLGEHPIKGHSVMRVFGCAAQAVEPGEANMPAAAGNSTQGVSR
jgi:class 3 adenylate cyclase